MTNEKRLATKTVAISVKGFLRESRNYNYDLADKFLKQALKVAEKELEMSKATALAVVNMMINEC